MRTAIKTFVAIMLIMVSLYSSLISQTTRQFQQTARIPIQTTDPSLKFTIEDGYGIDKNDNGIIDMPNSKAYVQRPLTVNFSANLPKPFEV